MSINIRPYFIGTLIGSAFYLAVVKPHFDEEKVIGCKPTETGVSLVMKNGEEKPNSRWRVDTVRGICYASNGGNTPPETLPLLKP